MRKTRPRHRALRMAVGLAIILTLGFAADAVVLVKTRAHADVPDPVGAQKIDVHAQVDSEKPRDQAQELASAQPATPQRDPGASRATLIRRLTKGSHAGSSDPWSLGMFGITLGLAVLGGIIAAGRRYLPQAAAPGIQVVGRANLSAKHTVYMLRVGRRVLLVGAGPQGSPSLISELDDLSEIESDPPLGDQP
jgi:Flagellar biosynthesis protein, FliO